MVSGDSERTTPRRGEAALTEAPFGLNRGSVMAVHILHSPTPGFLSRGSVGV